MAKVRKFTHEERLLIKEMLKDRYPIAKIAERLGRSHGVIYQEIKRNQENISYEKRITNFELAMQKIEALQMQIDILNDAITKITRDRT